MRSAPSSRAGVPPSVAINAAARSGGAALGNSSASAAVSACDIAPTDSPASPSRGPRGKFPADALASIYDRASYASATNSVFAPVSSAAPAAYMPAEARVLPASTRISELEDGAVELLLALLRQEHQNVQVLKQRAAQEADDSLSRSRRAPVEAELSSLATAMLSMPAGAHRSAQIP